MMAAPEGYSKACCTIPPVEAQYKEKGTFVDISGLKTYKTGPASATVALVFVYDIFGFCPQIEQGADILAYTTSSTHSAGYQVFIPDFLEGNYPPKDLFPPDTKEKQQTMQEYFGHGGIANPMASTKKLLGFAEELKKSGDGFEKIGAVGFCWGAKIVTMATVEGTPFGAAAYCHPSSITVEEAMKVTVPTCVLASMDEDKELIKGFGETLKVPKFIDTYAESPHGWMASRADFEDADSKANFEKGYATVLEFLHKHL